MRNYEQDFNETCKLMRKYMKSHRAQSFASAWGVFMKQKRACEIYEIEIQDISDIVEYAKKEQIERFGFEYK